MSLHLLRFSLLAFVLLLPRLVGAMEPIRLQGSDLLRPALADPLAKFAAEQALPLQIELTGSLLAQRHLQEATCDLAILTSTEKLEVPEGYMVLPFAFQTAMVVVNAENPLTEVSLTQLAGIFGQARPLEYKQWGELGLTGSWNSRTITLEALRSESSLILEIFTNTAMREYPLKTNINFHQESRGLVKKVGETIGSIGLSAVSPVPSNVKVLSVSTQEFSYPPSAEAVEYGDYPLSLKFSLCFRQSRQAEMRPLLQFLLSDEVASLLDAANFQSCARNTRRENSLMLELAKPR